jgi:membrane fusion protein, copper/silver efflux system
MRRAVPILIVVMAIVAVVGYAFRSKVRLKPDTASSNTTSANTASADTSVLRSQAAIPTTAATPRAEVSIDSRRQQLMGVRMAPARRVSLTHTIRTTGNVRADESRQTDVNLKVEGWIRDLYVDYTGQAVKNGQPLFTLYSPDLYTSEQEYILALKSRDQMQSSQIAEARDRADQLVASARQRLVLWGVPAEEIKALEDRREPQNAVVFRSPVDGVVMDKQAVKGAHIMPGQTLYKIADFSTVWIEADVYEAEMPLVRVGARAIVTLDAYPGERFTGRVIYIYPYVDEKSRTNKVRYQFANRGGRLKPGMYANVEINAASPGGAVAAAGIVVPADAVLDSGAEQVVFVAKGDGYFEPRRVKAGRRLGADIEIIEGIKEGEQVATQATFLLDSESQLRASLQGFDAPPAAPGAAPREELDITFRSQPDPPKMGDNQLEVMVKDASGKPIEDGDVSVQFFMAAMPTMNMPAMRNEVKLAPAGGGMYRGMGQVMMAGRWDATVTVTRGGQRVGSKQLTVVAR